MQSKSKSENRPLKIGITGGIGSGKTIVSKVFNLLGVPLYNADDRAKWIMSNSAVVKEGLIKIFGEHAFDNGILSRNFISQEIYKDQSKWERLNQLVHPEVGNDFQRWLEDKKEYSYILKEAALLYESGSYKNLDKIITVYAPVDIRIQRVLKRDIHRNEESVKKIINEQIDDNEKIKKADYVIHNDDKNMVIPQVLKLHEIIRSLK